MPSRPCPPLWSAGRITETSRPLLRKNPRKGFPRRAWPGRRLSGRRRGAFVLSRGLFSGAPKHRAGRKRRGPLAHSGKPGQISTNFRWPWTFTDSKQMFVLRQGHLCDTMINHITNPAQASLTCASLADVTANERRTSAGGGRPPSRQIKDPARALSRGFQAVAQERAEINRKPPVIKTFVERHEPTQLTGEAADSSNKKIAARDGRPQRGVF